ncbi:MAG: sigma-70 family RNA polymerase sigma factor [Planctomycetota bacterium]|nr:sigma-70 family RNA polymerase sigma factor [Planctomycetota bacterium]
MPPYEYSGQLANDRAFFVRVARGLVRDATDADDLVQDALVIAFRNGRVNGRADRAYVRGVLKNLALRSWRDRRRRRRRETHAAAPDLLPDSTQTVTRSETRRMLAADINTLPDVYRVPLMLRYYEELSPQEIARRLDVTPSTVRTRLQRARQRLRTRIDRRYGSGREALGAALIPLALESMPVGVAEATAASSAALGATTSTRILRVAAAAVLGVAVGSLAINGTPWPFTAAAPAVLQGTHDVATMDAAAESSAAAGTQTKTASLDENAAHAASGTNAANHAVAGTPSPAGSAFARTTPVAPASLLRGTVEGFADVAPGSVHVAAYRITSSGPESTPADTSTASSTGAFELRVPENGTWLVVAAASGRAPGALTVAPDGDTQDLRIALAPGLTLSSAFDASTAHGAVLARVRSTEPVGQTLQLGEGLPELGWSAEGVHWREVSVVPDDAGRLTVPGLRAGRFVVDLVAQRGTTDVAPEIVGRVELTVEAPAPVAPSTEVPEGFDAVVAETSSDAPRQDVVGRDVVAKEDTTASTPADEPASEEAPRRHGTPPSLPDTTFDPADVQVFDLGSPMWDSPRPRVDRPATRPNEETDDVPTYETGAGVTPAAVPTAPPAPVDPVPAEPAEPTIDVPVVPEPLPSTPPVGPSVPRAPIDTPAEPPADEPPMTVDPGTLSELERHNLLLELGMAWVELFPMDGESPPEAYHLARLVEPDPGALLKADAEPVLEYLGEVMPGQAPLVIPAGTYRLWCDSEIAEDPEAYMHLELFPGNTVMIAIGADDR